MARGTGSRDRTAPVVTITYPSNSQIFTTASTISVTATATDNKGVSKVEFYVKNNSTGAVGLLATDTSSPYSASWPVPTQLGYYTLTATAYDAAGNTASHSVVVLRTDSTTTTTTSTTAAPPPVLPSSKILATPTAWNQGGEGSCNAQATALQRSIEQYYTTGATSYSQSTNELSPEYIYNYTKFNDGCGSGSATLTNLSFCLNVGLPRWSLCPYNSQDGCSTAAFTQAMADDAANHKITGFGNVQSTDLYAMKRLICNNHGLKLDFQMDSNYYNAPSCDYIWNSRGTLMSTHSMVIIGYDDAKQAWLCQNSYGPNWACGGKIWVDYNFLATALTGAVWWMTTRVDNNLYPIL